MRNTFQRIGFALLCLLATTTPLRAQPAPVTPPLPEHRSPLEFFRQLLAATPDERDELLKEHSEAKRAIIHAKIQEYTILPPQVREWRLKATELRYYLLPLMKRAPDDRGELILTVPEADRELVSHRLAQWDALSREERDAMLNSQIALRYLSRPPLPPLPPEAGQPANAQFQRFQTSVANWQRLSEEEQSAVTRRFNAFFTLNEQEKQKTIAMFTGEERARLQRTMQAFEGMTDEERARCLNALEQIAGMSDREQARFVQNVERWRSLSEPDRQQWRNLVAKVPPLPPAMPPTLPR